MSTELKNYYVTGTNHGSIVSASSEAESRKLFHLFYNGESIVHLCFDYIKKGKVFRKKLQ